MATEITCRVGATNQTANTGAKLIVFLKTSEEAVCDPTENCDYTYTSVIPQITETSLVFDDVNGVWMV